MNRETGAWLAVALLSVSALGVSATTLESTVSTDANDVIDLEYDQLPIGQDDASNVLDEIEGSKRDGDATRPAEANEGESTQSHQTRPDDSASDATSNERSESQQQQQQRSQDESSSGAQEPPSLLDRLLALLTSLLPYLLGLAAVAGTIGLAVRYRERLAALFEEPEPEDADESKAEESAGLVEGSPAHPVERAWLGMVRHLDLDRPGTMTTSECASAAIEAGLDRDAVRTLTETYEEVRYGNQPVTARREERAMQSRRRLDGGGGA